VASTVVDTPIGPLSLIAGAAGLVRVGFGPVASVADPGGGAVAQAHVALAGNELEEYFAGRRRVFTVALDRSSRSGFRGAALAALEQVPYGELVTYGELAVLAGRPGAARAVGSAMATNPLPIVVPCHRVTRSGHIGGYGPGVATKEWLLRLEGSLPVPPASGGRRLSPPAR
jgi:methylated-DNA-[protein]-cysteine S-methyltransferase